MNLSAGHCRVPVRLDTLVKLGAVRMCGYAVRNEPCKGIHDALHAHCIALRSSEHGPPIVVLALDVCYLTVAQSEHLVSAVSSAAVVPAERILVNFSHTHQGPITMAGGAGVATGDQPQTSEAAYSCFVAASCEAALGALSDLRGVSSFRTAFADCPDLAYSRRQPVAGVPPGTERSYTIGNGPGPTQGGVHVWAFEREGGAPALLLLSAAAHGCVLPPEMLELSADWIGAVVTRVEADADGAGCRAILLQGAAGDQGAKRLWGNCIPIEEGAKGSGAAAGRQALVGASFGRIEQHGEAVSASVRAALRVDGGSATAHAAPLVLSVEASEIQLPALDGGGPMRCPVRGLRVGEGLLLGVAGEVCLPFAERLKAAHPGRSVVLCGYTNGLMGYICTAKQYDEGGYEPLGSWRYFDGGRPLVGSLVEPTVNTHVDGVVARLLADGETAASAPKRPRLTSQPSAAEAAPPENGSTPPLVAALHRLGVRPGDSLLVHSSYRAVRADLGPTASDPKRVLAQLLYAVGAEGEGGVIMMPTFTHGCPAHFDLEASAGKSGYLSELLRSHPAAHRSAHPTHSVAAVGRGAHELTCDHAEAFGAGCPIARLASRDGGKVLLLGVGHRTNSLLHVAETRAGVPKRCKYGTPPPNVEVRSGGKSWLHPLDASASCSAGFEAAAAVLRARGLVRHANCGDCLLQLITPARDALDAVAEALRQDPRLLLCNDPTCKTCVATDEMLGTAAGSA